MGYSQDRVKQARSYLKSIFDEAIGKKFLVKDPTRKLKSPKNRLFNCRFSTPVETSAENSLHD
jgi:hypothetical protein